MKYGTVENFVGGRFVSRESEYLPITSPINGSLIGEVVISTAKDVDDAVAAAEKAAPSWAELTNKGRSEVIYEYRNQLKAHREELAVINHTENGKSIEEALAGIDKAIELTEFACSMPQLVSGKIQEVSRGVSCWTVRVPLGVVASVTPFNFPVMVPHWTVPNAIALGNAVILKPSELTPVSASKMAELWKKAGLPDGILNVVNGAQEAVEAICDHEGIQALSFVGSTPVAKAVYRRATANLKRVLALGGAKNHLVIVPDAHPEMAARDILASFTGMAGQRCMAASTLICVGDVDSIVQRVCGDARKMVPGRDIPPLISQDAVGRIARYLDRARQGGAEVLVDGTAFKPYKETGGYFVGPSVIDYREGGQMSDEEVFGPTLELLAADSLREAVAIQKRSPFGNAASIFTQNGRTAQEAVGAFSAGMCGINIGIPVPREPFSFGGWNASRFGWGDITGEAAIEFWTQLKKVSMKWNPEDKRNWMS